jgi:hypothetical protein
MADKPRSFDEVPAAMDSAEPARIKGMESFVTDEGKVNLMVDPEEPGGWRVEFLENDDASGSLHFTVFAGPMAEQRARDYFGALKSGTLQIVREDDRDGGGD